MKVILNCRTFEYDVHSLVKAFYPEEDVTITEDSDDFRSMRVTIEPDAIPLPGDDTLYSGTITIENISSDALAGLKVTQVDKVDRALLKSEMKRALYRALADMTGKELPWGTLTGIRPCKIPMKLLEEGKDDAQIRSYMKDTYLVSDEKIELATAIAKRERGILSGLSGRQGFSLYVGIPFCPTRCLYCSFTSYPIAKFANKVDDYLAALKREIDFIKGAYDGRVLDSVYIGGGTPTSISADALGDLIGYLQDTFDFSTVREFTVEAGRPDSITRQKLEVLKQTGVTRMSINPQTMNQSTLDIIGRRHTVEQVKDAFLLARDVGHDNINMDIIMGLPGETEAEVEHTLSEIEKLSPDSLTVHSMAIKRAAGMHDYLGQHPELASVNTPQIMDMAAKSAERMGMKPYYLYRQKNMSGNFENVGYAKDVKYGIYNILIMEEMQDIAAAGAGTISKRLFDGGRIERCDDVKDIDLYLRDIDRMIDKKREFYKGDIL